MPKGFKPKHEPRGKLYWDAYFRAYGLPEPELEVKFHPERQWRLDLAWPGPKVAVEIQGGVRTYQPSHMSAGGRLRDMEKANAALALGWVVLQVTWDQVKTGEISTLVGQAILARAKEIRRASEKETGQTTEGA